MGLHTEHPMIGHDLTGPDADRAMMQYGENYGYLKGDSLLVLEPHKEPTQYTWTPPDNYSPIPVDAGLAREARAHALWPNWVYKNHAYTLHALRAKTKPQSGQQRYSQPHWGGRPRPPPAPPTTATQAHNP